jgi:hypothetical protein
MGCVYVASIIDEVTGSVTYLDVRSSSDTLQLNTNDGAQCGCEERGTEGEYIWVDLQVSLLPKKSPLS